MCIGIPMQVIASGFGYARCQGLGMTREVETLLVGDQEFDSPKTLAAFALGLVLFFVTLLADKLIILLVLMNQPGQEAAFARMEDMVYNEIPEFLH